MLKGRSKWVWGVGKRVGCTSGHNGWDCNHLMARGGGGERTEFACAASTEARAAPPRWVHLLPCVVGTPSATQVLEPSGPRANEHVSFDLAEQRQQTKPAGPT